MDALIKRINNNPITIGNWKSEYDFPSGTIFFQNSNSNLIIWATPDWEIEDEAIVEEGHRICIEVHDEEDNDLLTKEIKFFGTYDDYKLKMEIFINGTELDEIINTQLTPLERAKGLVNINNIRALRMSLKSLYSDLEDEGFEHEESIELLTTMIKGYLEDIDIPYGVLEESDDIL